jgi:hypothetical protein
MKCRQQQQVKQQHQHEVMQRAMPVIMITLLPVDLVEDEHELIHEEYLFSLIVEKVCT